MALTTEFKAVPRRKLVDEVLDQMQSLIRSGRYKNGDKLPPEPELMKMLAVGRSTIREAVKILVHAGLLEVRQGDGTYIRSPSMAYVPLKQTLILDNYGQIMEMRTILEAEIAVRAAQRRTAEQLKEMRESLDLRNKLLHEGQYAAYVEADIRFHQAIAEATGNQVLVGMYTVVAEALKEMLSQLILNTGQYDDQSVLHEAIYEAIAAQNGEEARRCTLLNLGAARPRF